MSLPALLKKFLTLLLSGGILGLGLLWSYQLLHQKRPSEDFAQGNGRIEAVEIQVATKVAGRVQEIQVNDGDFVRAGAILARMDTAALRAQLREARAHLRQAEIGVEVARSRQAQLHSEKVATEAVVAQRQAELEVARKRLERSRQLTRSHAIPLQQLDDDEAAFLGAQAVLRAAQAQVMAAQAAIVTAQAQIIGAEAAVDAAQATIERLQADLDDSALKSPRDGRVQFRVAQPGEVLGAGGIVLTLLDLTDVSMTFFLPTAQAGRLALGAEARLILDAAPGLVIPARVSFVASEAQFTPKTVETASEREKLMFRIKAQIAPELLRRHIEQVKTGLPGVAYVRLNPQADWPPHLQLRSLP
ncbi:HlyD family secretion protein [Desulfuromonas thiophila]|uniref:HlyD family secretion protein n=1 Tax=Desulfuromonas thiophila TaxID=57664 RepID=A0A1G7D8I6_9BACT|nr:HlyD family efflux transporter periplasmic adaptor subunit [Desulfuromonas thiophila]SDE47807.1 HlyD family secretion protein [Desulfuromonas thiophila]